MDEQKKKKTQVSFHINDTNEKFFKAVTDFKIKDEFVEFTFDDIQEIEEFSWKRCVCVGTGYLHDFYEPAKATIDAWNKTNIIEALCEK